VVASIIATLCASRAAADSPIVSLSYQANDACPNAAAFLDMAIRKSEGVVLEATADADAQGVVILRSTESGFTGRLSLRRRSGTYLREMAATSCEDLASALAFVLGLALVQEYGETKAVLAPEPLPPPPEHPNVMSRPSPRFDFWPGAQIGARAGTAPGGAITEGAFVDLRLATGIASTLRAGVMRAEPNRDSMSDHATEFSWVAAFLESCVLRVAVHDAVELLPCLGAQVGSVRATGTSAHPSGSSDTQSRLAIELAPALRLEVRPVSAISLQLTAFALVPLRHYTFYFDRPYTEVYQVPYLAAAGTIGVSFRVR
jgi:hypothetical protein